MSRCSGFVYSDTYTDLKGNIDANLVFGASDSDFLLDFRNNLGMPFDPNKPLAVGRIESLISSSFSEGKLAFDLNNLFTVGFMPTINVSSFTVGGQDQVNIAGTEPAIPEPSSVSLVLLACLLSAPAASRGISAKRRG
jgi:hypothetical protein